MQLLDFQHQRFVNGQATRGIHQQDVKEVLLGVIQCRTANIDWLLVRAAGKPFGTGLRSHRLELLDRGRAVNVCRDGKHFFLALFDQVLGQLAGGGGFTGTLQASHQNDGRRLGCQVDIAHALAHGGGQLFVNDADQYLAGLQGTQHVLAQGFFFHTRNKVADHR